MDVQRASVLFSLMAGPAAGRVGGGAPAGEILPPEPPSFNPFKGKTAAEIDQGFRNKGYSTSGPDPLNGKGGYINPRSNRSYHIDENNSFGEPPHVDVNRLRTYKGPLPKRKFPM